MHLQTLSALAVRITGIFLGLYVVRLGLTLALSWQQSSQDPWLFVSLSPTVIMAAAAVCMMVFPRTVAGKLLPVVKGEPEAAPAADDLARAGAALIGLYLLIQAALDAVWLISYYVVGRDHYGTGSFWSQNNTAAVAGAVAELAAAVWLLLGARGFMAIVRWSRRVHAD